MKVIAKIKEVLQDYRGNTIASFLIPNYTHRQLLQGLDPNKEYSLEIKEVKSKRTLQQNKYMWALFHEIDVAMNGEATNEMDVYITCLELANAKFDYIACLPEAEEALRANFRAVKFMKTCMINGKEANAYKVFIGSSKMDVKEMNMVIDKAIEMAQELGIETDYYIKMLKE